MKRISPDFTTLSHDQLSDAAPPAIPWLWHGYLAPGNITLLTGQWKCGKTTLLAALLSRLGQGGLLAGRAVAPGRAVIVSEESPAHWHQRSQKFPFGPHLSWLCRPFPSKPTTDQWLALINHLATLTNGEPTNGEPRDVSPRLTPCNDSSAASAPPLAPHPSPLTPLLVVIDSLAVFLPGHSENDAALMLEALLPLQQLAAQNVALLLLHHPRKKDAAPGRLARGSGALSSFADVLIEMDWHASPTDPDRRRRLRAFSRHADTPQQLVIELNPEGADYQSLGTLPEVEFADRWQLLRPILQAATRKLPRRTILDRWPADQPTPAPNTLWRWLDHAVDQGLLRRTGAGRKSDPFLFWLPEKDKDFSDDITDWIHRLDREDQQLLQRLRSGP